MARISSETWSWARRGLGLALLAGEAVIVLGGAMAARVSPDYRAFFITHERTCWLPPGAAWATRQSLARRPGLDFARLTPAEACYMLPPGWRATARGAAMLKPNASIVLPVPPGATGLALTLAGPLRSGSQRLILTTDQGGRATITLPAGGGEVSVSLLVENGGALRVILAQPGLFAHGHAVLRRAVWQFSSGAAKRVP